jgi:serine/threonine protein kinase
LQHEAYKCPSCQRALTRGVARCAACMAPLHWTAAGPQVASETPQPAMSTREAALRRLAAQVSRRPLPPDVSESKLHDLAWLQQQPPELSLDPPTLTEQPSGGGMMRSALTSSSELRARAPQPRPQGPISRAAPPPPPAPRHNTLPPEPRPRTLPPDVSGAHAALPRNTPPRTHAVPTPTQTPAIPPAPPSRAVARIAPPSRDLARPAPTPSRPPRAAERPTQHEIMQSAPPSRPPPGPVSRSLRPEDPTGAPEAPRSREGRAQLGAVALSLQSVPASAAVYREATREQALTDPPSRQRPTRDTQKQPALEQEIEARALHQRDGDSTNHDAEPDDAPPPPTGDGQDPFLGMRVGNARLTARIGHGGMGAVYLAEHQVLRTPYAVKVLHRQLSRDRRVVERFRREALACSRLQHPNVVFVTDFGYKKDLGLYIIMEYLEGRSLAELVFQQKELAVERVIQICTQIADALHAAHKLGIIHRDLKSENIQLVKRGDQHDFVKVLDFGIARLRAASSQLTAVGMVLGSPHYMSPEQIQGFKEKVGPTSDIYALGIILYEMLAGDVPFDAPDPIDVCKRHLREVPPRASIFRPELRNTRLEALVARMLEKEPEHRPASMREVAQELKAAHTELRRLGLILEEGEPLDESQRGAQATARRAAIARTVDKLRAAHPDSPLVEAILPLSGLERLPQETFRLLLWGPLERELAEATLHSKRLHVAQLQLGVLVQMALEDDDLTLHSSPWLTSLGSFLRHLDSLRQDALLNALGPFSTHPKMPPGILPGWTGIQASGSWMPLSRDADSLSEDEELLSMLSSASMPALRRREDDDLDIDIDVDGDDPPSHSPLIEKLRRPVSVKAVKSVLNHDISNLWRRKDLDEEPR